MRLEINLEHYQVFYYVAKLGSISKTAEALHLTQPAVSHIIKLLEYRLGCQLFYRRSRGVELTGNGAILLPYVSSMLNQITAGEKRITKLVNLEEGELSRPSSRIFCPAISGASASSIRAYAYTSRDRAA